MPSVESKFDVTLDHTDAVSEIRIKLHVALIDKEADVVVDFVL